MDNLKNTYQKALYAACVYITENKTTPLKIIKKCKSSEKECQSSCSLCFFEYFLEKAIEELGATGEKQ